MLLRFTSSFQKNKTNSRSHNQNSAVLFPFLTDYNYLCFIRATAKWHKEESWYEVIYAKVSIKELNFLKMFG